MASIDLYTKQQIDAKIPDTSGASSGDVLTFNGSANVWAAPGGGGSGLTAHTYTSYNDMQTDLMQHPDAIVYVKDLTIKISHTGVTQSLSFIASKLKVNNTYYNLEYTRTDFDSNKFLIEDIHIDKSQSPSPATLAVCGLAFASDGSYSSYYSIPRYTETFTDTYVQNHIIVYY